MSWNGSENKDAPKKPKKTVVSPPSKWRGLVALVVVVIAGGLAAWLFVGGEKGGSGEKVGAKPSQIAEVKPQIATNQVVAMDEVDEKADDPVPPPATPKKPASPPVYRRVMTMMDGTVVTNETKSIFKRPFENILAAALRPTGTGRTLLFTVRCRYSDAELMKMLQEMTLPDEGDSEGVRKCKQEVQQLKEDILLEVANGKTLDEVFADITRQHADDQMVRVKTLQMQQAAIRSGDADSVRAANAAANRMRTEYGLEQLELPNRFKPPETDDGWGAIPEEDGGEDQR